MSGVGGWTSNQRKFGCRRQAEPDATGTSGHADRPERRERRGLTRARTTCRNERLPQPSNSSLAGLGTQLLLPPILPIVSLAFGATQFVSLRKLPAGGSGGGGGGRTDTSKPDE